METVLTEHFITNFSLIIQPWHPTSGNRIWKKDLARDTQYMFTSNFYDSMGGVGVGGGGGEKQVLSTVLSSYKE